LSGRPGRHCRAFQSFSRGAAFLLAVLGLGLEANTGLAGSAAQPMVWHRGELGDPGSLDPHKATTLIESNILDELFEGLVALNARGEIIPGVATSWTVDPTGTIYDFRLRPDAKWSNGDTVTPDDFVFAFRRLIAPATGAPYASVFYTLKNAQKINKGE
jgi:oligopeptide transport system substrate-binding protein